jgi:hypothetical protein
MTLEEIKPFICWYCNKGDFKPNGYTSNGNYPRLQCNNCKCRIIQLSPTRPAIYRGWYKGYDDI